MRMLVQLTQTLEKASGRTVRRGGGQGAGALCAHGGSGTSLPGALLLLSPCGLHGTPLSPQVPEERFIFMKLTYHDHTPEARAWA